MVKRQTSHVKDVRRSESMHLPEDLPYETYAKINISLVCNNYCISAQANKSLSRVSWKIGIGQT